MSVDFIDSNVVLYLFDDVDVMKRETAEGLVYSALAENSGVVSYQVVQETLNVLVGKLGATPSDTAKFLDTVISPLWRVGPTPTLYRAALEIRSQFRFSFYDSTIIAAAQVAGSARLWSEDLQHGQRIGSLTILNPFV